MAEVIIYSALVIILVAGFIFIGHRSHVADWDYFFINVIDGWIRLYCRYFHHFIYQPVPVAKHGPTLLACNHISGLDPFLIVAACQHPIRFMIAQEEYQRFGLQWLFRAAGCIPVERSGRVETAFRATLSALQNNEVVVLFPEGGINRTTEPLQKLKAGIVKLAKMAEVPISPLRVEGMRGQGDTMTALFLPSDCYLTVMPALNCVNQTDKDCLLQLALFLQLKC